MFVCGGFAGEYLGFRFAYLLFDCAYVGLLVFCMMCIVYLLIAFIVCDVC